MSLRKPVNFPLSVGAFGTPIWRGGDGPLGVINQDITNSALIGFDSGLNPSECVTLAPLGFQAFDGEMDLFATALTGAPTVQVVKGLQQWAPSPAQVATQINALGLMKDTTGQTINTTAGGTTTAVNNVPTGISNTGVPLLNKATNLLNTGATNINAGSTSLLGTLTMSQIGYEIFINVVDNSAGNTNPFAVAEMVWSDSATGQIVSQEFWGLSSGAQGSGGQGYYGTGPSKGDTLKVSVNNPGSIQITVNVSLNQHSRIYQRDDWRSVNPLVAVNGWTISPANPPGNILAATSNSIANAAHIDRLMPLYAGMINWWVTPSTGTATWTMKISAQDNIVSSGNPSQVVFFTEATGGASAGQGIALPRSVCIFTLTNTSAATATFTTGFFIQEQPQ